MYFFYKQGTHNKLVVSVGISMFVCLNCFIFIHMSVCNQGAWADNFKNDRSAFNFILFFVSFFLFFAYKQTVILNFT